MARRHNVQELKRHADSLVQFDRALSELFNLSKPDRDHWDGPTIEPKPGRESDWFAAKAKVDRLSYKAARAYDVAGVVINWKPRGTMATSPINPATNWATILGPDPSFSPADLGSCTNIALGSLEDQTQNPPKRQRTRDPSLGSMSTPIRAIIVTVIGGLIVAGIAYWLGWV